MSGIYPKQKISSKEKYKIYSTNGQTASLEGKTWGEVNVDYFIDQIVLNDDYEEMLRLYRLDNSELDKSDYNHVLNPFNTDVEKYTKFSAKLKNFDIITPIIELYVGEYGKRLKNFEAVGTNPQAESIYEKKLSDGLRNLHAQTAINGLNAAGVETGQPSKEQPSVEQFKAEFKRTYSDNHIITGNEILDYIKYNEDLDEKYIKMYYDWCKVGRVISYKDVIHNDVNLEHVDPLECYFPKNSKSPFVEDGDWFIRKQRVSPNYILDRYHDKLSDAEVEALDSLNRDKGDFAENTGYTWMPTAYITNDTDKKLYSITGDNDNNVDLIHVVWRSFQKVGILYRTNPIGEVEEIEVDDTYKLDKEAGDIDIDWGWITELWEGEKVEDSAIEDIYINVRPIPYDRADLNNSSEQKLPYNGRYSVTKSGEIKSISKIGFPYQILYNIVYYQTERMINRNMDKVLLMPLGLLPKDKEGWDEEKALYHSRATGFLFTDETSPNFALGLQGVKVLDMSLTNFINQSRELLLGIKGDWWEAVGMNRQRFGDTKASDGKGVTEQAIFRSAIISEELNRKFEKFQEKDYDGLLDISKIAFLDGKKAKYINSAEREMFLNMNADDVINHTNTSYNVFIKNSIKEEKKLAELQQYMFSYAQNSGSSTVFMEALDMSNFTKGKEVIRKLEDNERQMNESLQKQQMESASAVEGAKRESEQADRDVKIYEADKKAENAVEVALIKEGIDSDSNNTDQDGIDDNMETGFEARDQDRKDRELEHKMSTDNKKVNLETKKVKIQEKLANSTISSNKNKNTNNQ